MAAIHKLAQPASAKSLKSREKLLTGKASSIEQVCAAQKTAALEFSDRETKTRALGLLEEARRDIYERIANTDAETFTAAQLNSAAAQVETVITEMVGKQKQAFKAVSIPLSEHGIQSLLDVVEATEEKFSGAVVRLPISEALNFRVLDESKRSLLRQFTNSMASYGAGLVRDIEHELSMSMLMNEPVHKTLKKLSQKSPLFESAQWKAERIWRTELANSYETSRAATMQWMKEEHFPDLQRRSIDPIDNRTGSDSVYTAGQVRDLDKPFFDGVREFMHHPNRPNDRGTETPIRKTWETI